MSDKPTATDEINKDTAAILMAKMDTVRMHGPVSACPQADVPERDDAEWDETASADAVYAKYLSPVDGDGKPIPWSVGN